MNQDMKSGRTGAGLITILAVLSVSPSAVFAQGDHQERFTLAVGAYKVFRYNSSALLANRDLGVGVAISPEDILGLNSRQTVFRMEGSWAFRPRHLLTFSWYDISATNSLSIGREIDWIDENRNPITIPIGASVSSRLSYDIRKLGYLWNFYDTDKVRLAAGAGLHWTDVSLSLNAESTSSGVDASDGDTLLPLPVLSFGLAYHVTPRFHWYFKSEFFVMSFDDWSGSYNDALLGAEYRVWEHLGIGIAFNSNALKAVEEARRTRFEFENRISGAVLFLRGHF